MRYQTMAHAFAFVFSDNSINTLWYDMTLKDDN